MGGGGGGRRCEFDEGKVGKGESGIVPVFFSPCTEVRLRNSRYISHVPALIIPHTLTSSNTFQFAGTYIVSGAETSTYSTID